ncbi:hypothetical protein JRQ81_009359 [Phrynocephalus forsythii]|uniref:Mucin-1 n=1 Tax=Phrynocephalus forsythii TaxID=171643 RepID=A0A9Q0XBK7_9SAUR|nr:hypothetical protein JRQ81_009359 [Phrynocephalus forsythii]
METSTSPTTANTTSPTSSNVTTETTTSPTTANTTSPTSSNMTTETTTSPTTEKTTSPTSSDRTTETTTSPTTANTTSPTSSNVTTETTTSPTTATTTSPTSSNVTTETTTSPTTATTTSPTSSNKTTETTSGHSSASKPTTPVVTSHSISLPPSRQTTQKPTTAANTTAVTEETVIMYFRITNRNFTPALLKPFSPQYKNLDHDIGLIGSVVVKSEIYFRNDSKSSATNFLENVTNTMKNAPDSKLHGLKLSDISAYLAGATTPAPSPNPGVPGWGIALLVLVCFLVLLAIIAFLALVVYWCRRHQRGKMDLLSSRDAYHPMSEYPTYQSHGRYAAPNSKQNPYNETLPKNGASRFSYTNPTMANDDM